MTAVSVRDLTMRYKGHDALCGVTLELAENRIHGLLGRNGAGKTSLMRILTGQEFETSGSVRVFGSHPRENTAVLDRVCFIRESLKYPDVYRLQDALFAASLAFPGWDADYAEQLVEEFEVPRNRRIKKFSRGQHSAVGVVIGLASRAPLTLFDEPYLGLDAVARRTFYDHLLADFAENPRTVVLSTHLIDEVSDLIEHVVLIDRGRILMDEDAESLRGRAVSVSGPVDAVEAYAAGHEVLHRQKLGGHVRIALRERPDISAAGLAIEPLSLQDLIVMTTQAVGRQGADAGNTDPVLTTAGTTSKGEVR
jgi:ABC-2 type transport system ATP-binding protein